MLLTAQSPARSNLLAYHFDRVTTFLHNNTAVSVQPLLLLRLP
jgi:hypothetical protein